MRTPRTQTAAVVEQFGKPYSFKQIPCPKDPEGHDILIKVLAASYCHTDAVFAAGLLSQDLPRIGCHEFAGEVIALGPSVSDHRGIALGIKIGVPGRAYHPCGTCFECTHPGQDDMGYSPYCPSAGNLGLTRDGGFQEYCLVDSRQVAVLPGSLPPTQAAPLMCAGLTIWSALQHEKVQNAQRVGIIGAGGGLGHIGVQFAAYLGKEVLAVDATDQALGLVQKVKESLGEVGKNIFISDARREDSEVLKAMLRPADDALPTEVGLDAVILLPESQKAFDTGMKLLKNHGTMVVVSFPSEKLQVSAHDLVFRDIAVVGSLVGRNHQLREMLYFVDQNGIRVHVKTFAFDQLNELRGPEHHAGGGKLVIDMTLKRDN
ncbi:alcohol dehydrogenase 1 [Fusarium sp. NRRL 25303]|nr:alcohol dehydrogenase 1 [Fusarium sp. NRRL 25303]